jgi:outer membrane immunogenic protein
MKKLFLATVSLLALSRAALAADLETKAPRYQAPLPAYWAGSYVGIQGGFVQQDGSLDIIGDIHGGAAHASKVGGTAGGVLGYNWQLGSFVYGVEGDWSALGGKGTTNGDFLQTSFGANWVATARGRAGLAVDATLFYLTGGLAFGHLQNSVIVPGEIFLHQDTTKAGWTAGVGIEHMLSANWTAKAEFRYVDFGTSSASCSPGFGSCSFYRSQFGNTLKMGLVGLNYKF